MAKLERVLAVDIGASSIKAGEFEYPPSGGLTLVGFAMREYTEELNETNRGTVVATMLKRIILENAFVARKVLVSISGQSAFIRFVKLPPVAEEEKRIRQIVEFEARQNVPFPIDQVIWDYQLIANPEAEEMEVMFVVIKNDIVEQITGALESLGLIPMLVDVATVACYNCARANHVGDDECAMILNIGGRSCNLLFADRARFFARTIPIAGYSITQQIAKEFNIGMDEAEELKRRHGFVSLGGAYEAPESEVAATVSKIVRSVMTRLHGEINRSISVYRAQQKGNRPTRLFLTGGSSIMAYTDRFFQEALSLDVGYLNPFQVVTLGPEVNRQQLQEVAHLFAEVVGLGLRYRLQCPVEVSLIPEKIRRRQAFQLKKPYFAGAIGCVLVMGLVAVLSREWRVNRFSEVFSDFSNSVNRMEKLQTEINQQESETSGVKSQYDSVTAMLEQRNWLPQVLNEIQALKPGDVWLAKLKPIYGDMKEVGSGVHGGVDSGGLGGPGGPGGDMMMPGGMGMGMGGMGGMPMFPGSMGGPGGGGGGSTSTVSGTSVSGFVISGFEIDGHSVRAKAVAASPEERSGKTTPAAPAPGAAPESAPPAGTATAVPGATAPADGSAPAAPAGTTGEAVAAAPVGTAPANPFGAPEATPAPGAAPVPGTAAGSTAAALADQEKNLAPELVFLDRIRRSELFDDNPKMTAISSYVPSDSVRNLNSFTLQVKLKKPINIAR